ncbi:MAG TPA: glycosyltransferase family 2 protein [Candidatus Udaeobacter sp.]|nr:glycosyltransferase family 2 protein [Candidatus Udaeobacter sp.]
MRVAALIPARNEAGALPGVLADLARVARGIEGVRLIEIVVVDNGSSDATAEVARAAGATVVAEPCRGYGAACLTGLDHLRRSPPDVVAFLDGDASDDPADLPALIAPIAAGEVDLAIGSRTLGTREAGALTPVQELGNALAASMIRALFGARVSDLGPFRVARWEALERLGMRDRDYGWTVEMQTRALRAHLRCREVPVRYRRRRTGRSKVAGTLRGAVFAGAKILWTIVRVRLGG